MTLDESIAEADGRMSDWTAEAKAAEGILLERGWGNVFVHGVGGGFNVGGVSPYDGVSRWKNTAMMPDGPDTPDNPVEAALWLDAHAKRLAEPAENAMSLASLSEVAEGADSAPETDEMGNPININVAPVFHVGGSHADSRSQAEREAIAETERLFDAGGEAEDSAGHETHGETGAEAGGGETVPEGLSGEHSGPLDLGGGPEGDTVLADDGLGDDSDAAAGPEISDDDKSEGGAPDGGEWRDAPEELDEPLDADFTDFGDLEGADALPELDAPELGEELEAEHPDEFAPQDSARFYGLDDLDRRRSLRIGDVVRISHAKQQDIWAEAGATEGEFASLHNAVLRDTVGGVYRGEPEPYARFVALQGYANAAASVRSAEHDKVAFLNAATRDEVEAFDPEADWP